MGRRSKGEETWHRLKEWDRGTAPSERLAALLLEVEGYQSVDPSHPLGGPDGLKDLVCDNKNKRWVVGVYFPRGEVKFAQIKKKFAEDIKGVGANKADGFIFIINQELSLAERKKLRQIKNNVDIELSVDAIAGISDHEVREKVKGKIYTFINNIENDIVKTGAGNFEEVRSKFLSKNKNLPVKYHPYLDEIIKWKIK
ncbi:MAG: hypothetical protein IIB08_07970 [Bacteroidetes bacterium]|nr:hypothetical protein [Bacteroidota bacterium]